MDIRILKTKARLMEALSELTKNRSIEEISVAELCREAGVNRTTFYKYYSIPADVQRESFDRHMEEVVEEIRRTRPYGLYSTLLFCCRKYQENYLVTKQVFPGFQVNEDAIRSLYLNLEEPEVFGDPEKIYFIAGGTATIIQRWLTETPERTPEEVAGKLAGMIGAVLQTDEAFSGLPANRRRYDK